VIPLASQFSDLSADVLTWIEGAEQEVKGKALTPTQIKQKQEATKVAGF